jgi:hypothetical protein
MMAFTYEGLQMRFLAAVVLAAAIVAPVHAQTAPQVLVGPSFIPSAIQRDRFDAVFLVKVAMAGVPVLRNQMADARYDAIVCNPSGKARGGARADLKSDRLSVLEPGNCTMFANISQLELTFMEPGGEWTAEIYLRAHR